MSEGLASAPSAREGPEGLGGYLIMPMLGLVVTPLVGVAALNHHLGPAVFFSVLTGGQKAFVMAEILAFLAITVACPMGLLALMFGRKRAFPRLYIAWAASSAVWVLVDLAAASIVLANVLEEQGVALFDTDAAISIQSYIRYSVLWILYMHKSRRVQNTFTQ
jgi:hypothetical protein